MNLDNQFKDSVLLVKFDDLATNPIKKVDEITRFMGTTQTRKTSKIMKRENLPRSISDKSHSELEITKNLSPEILEVFHETMELYEEFCSYA